jgi:hypothetical protein
MALEHQGLSGLNVESSDNWIATSHKNMRISDLHAFDGLFGSDETFNNFILS